MFLGFNAYFYFKTWSLCYGLSWGGCLVFNRDLPSVTKTRVSCGSTAFASSKLSNFEDMMPEAPGDG